MKDGNRLSALDRQIVWDRMNAAVEEQAQTLIRTAFSNTVREAGDLSAGIFDLRGRMLVQAVTGTPGHVNAMAASVAHFIARFPVESMRPGDVYITNDPWRATGHLHDFTVVTPCFRGDRAVGMLASTSHVVDVGGRGFGPDARQVYEEGIFIPIMKLMDAGRIDQALIDIVRANVREPTQLEGDFYSLAACNEVGCRRLVETMDGFGIDDLDAIADYIVDTSHRAMLREIAALPAGSWRHAMRIDGYEAPVDLVATLTVGDSGIDIDFDGTSGVSDFGINVPLPYTQAYATFGVRCVVGAEIPNNAGSLAAVRVAAPEGCILNARPPRAVAARHAIGQMLPDVVLGCLHRAVADIGPAERHFVPVQFRALRRRRHRRRPCRRECGAVHRHPVPQRRHRSAAGEGRAVGHGVSVGRAQHAGGNQRGDRADPRQAQGIPGRLGGRRPSSRRRRPGHGDPPGSTARRSPCRRCSTACAFRRAGATAAATAPPAGWRSRAAPSCGRKAARPCPPATR